jgi:hypothetical protein
MHYAVYSRDQGFPQRRKVDDETKTKLPTANAEEMGKGSKRQFSAIVFLVK